MEDVLSHIDMEGLDLQSLDMMGLQDSFNPERLGKFTASEDYKLMTGVDYTQEQRINSVKNSFKMKADMVTYAKEKGIIVPEKATMLDIATLIEPMEKDKLTEGGETHVKNKVIELLTGQPINDFESFDMRRGKEMEKPTIDWVKEIHQHEIKQCLADQIFHQQCENDFLNGHVGVTPDGYIPLIDCGFEGKAPKKETHYDYLFGTDKHPPLRCTKTLKEVENKYYWQIVKGLYMTGWKGFVFTSFCPDFLREDLRDITFTISREEVKEDMVKLEKRLEMAVARKNDLLLQIDTSWKKSA